MSQELENAVAEMEKRLAALEQGSSASKGPESERERMQRERQERIDAKREARPENDERRMGDPRPTSRQRKEDLSRRSSTVLPGPTMNPPRAASPPAQTSQTSESTHPWKVTSNGNGSVNVASGFIGWWEMLGSDRFVHVYEKFASSTVSVSGAGYIIACYTANDDSRSDVNLVDEGVLELRAMGKIQADKSVRFSSDPTAEADDIIVVIAEVSLSGGISQVNEQVISHNPIVEIGQLLLS